jgi:hypothetical protein
MGVGVVDIDPRDDRWGRRWKTIVIQIVKATHRM